MRFCLFQLYRWLFTCPVFVEKSVYCFWITSTPLLKVSWPCMCGSVTRLCFSLIPSLCQSSVVLIFKFYRSLEIRQNELSIFSFQNGFSYFSFFAFPYEFWVQFANSLKKRLLWFCLILLWIYRSIWIELIS